MPKKKTKPSNPLLQMEEKNREVNSREEKNDFGRSKKWKYFALVLYPQDNEQNCNADIMRYIENNRLLFPSYMYVTHDKDVDEKGEPKKSHVHMLVSVREGMTVKGMYKHFAEMLNASQISGVENRYVYAQYMMHKTYEAEKAKKHVYKKEEFYGTSDFLHLLEQNANFVQKSIVSKIKEYGYISDVLDECTDVEFAEYWKNATAYNGISNQQLNRIRQGEYKRMSDTQALMFYYSNMSVIEEALKRRKRLMEKIQNNEMIITDEVEL